MSNLAKDLTGEVIGFFVTAFVAIIMIIILATFGEATGQTEIIKNVIQGILILAFGIGIPLGVFSIIKFLSDEFGNNGGI